MGLRALDVRGLRLYAREWVYVGRGGVHPLPPKTMVTHVTTPPKEPGTMEAGEILLGKGLLDQRQLDLSRESQTDGLRLDQVAVNLGFITEEL